MSNVRLTVEEQMFVELAAAEDAEDPDRVDAAMTWLEARARPKHWVVTGASMVIEAYSAEQAILRAQDMSGWNWEAEEVDE